MTIIHLLPLSRHCPARSPGSSKHWSGIITYPSDRIRIISVRRSRKEEVAHYETEELDKKFEEGEDITGHLDLSRARRVNQELRRVNVDFPVWVIEALDKEAKRLGVSRQALLKVWIAERLERSA